MPNPNGAVAGNSQNVPEAQTPRTRSTFPLHYHMFNTHRFGELCPHYVEDLVKGDVLPIRSSHQLRSYTLDSPLLQNVKRNKDYFLVPMESILPLNWEKFFDNPVRGDDVLDDVGPTVEGFWLKVTNFNLQLVGALMGSNGNNGILTSTSSTNIVALQACLRYMILLEYFYSNGNLLASLGCHGAQNFRYNGNNFAFRSFDQFFDSFITLITTSLNSSTTQGNFSMSVDGYSYIVVSDIKLSPGSPEGKISLRHALQLMRDNPAFTITAWNGVDSTLRATLATFFNTSFNSFSYVSANIPLNLSRLWAYQLCCAHYMSNDHIDFVYSAELFRQLVGSYVLAQTATQFNQSAQVFSRNGITYRYDYLSAHFCSLFLTTYSSSGTFSTNLLTLSSSQVNSALGYFSALFGYRRSLRYVDYFTGVRAQPLAVASSTMNTNVAVNAGQVSVIDITKSIQAQRFLNAVNRVRHNFEGYLKGVFGGKIPAPDYHNPFYLAHTDDVIFGQETENTGVAQMQDDIAITTNLRSNSGNFVFEVVADRPAIAIGITSYEITRVYSKSIERSFFHQNRFDWFNPFMQYIGDQPVYIQELGINPNAVSSLTNFGYSIRHEEYKQRYSQCAGGFVENLPGWIFLASDLRGDQATINPDWIRSLNAEFDQFYVSLTGWSLGSYFHFIVDDFNSVNASRPMAYAPTIL